MYRANYWFVMEQCAFRWANAPFVGSSEKSRRSLARQRSISSPQKPTLIAQLIIRRTWLAQHSPLRFYPDRTDPYGNKAGQGKRTQSSPDGPALEKPTLVLRAASAARSSLVAGSPLSGEQDNMAPPDRAVGSAPLASWWEPANIMF